MSFYPAHVTHCCPCEDSEYLSLVLWIAVRELGDDLTQQCLTFGKSMRRNFAYRQPLPNCVKHDLALAPREREQRRPTGATLVKIVVTCEGDTGFGAQSLSVRRRGKAPIVCPR
jgi:hypothetical protein